MSFLLFSKLFFDTQNFLILYGLLYTHNERKKEKKRSFEKVLKEPLALNEIVCFQSIGLDIRQTTERVMKTTHWWCTSETFENINIKCNNLTANDTT